MDFLVFPQTNLLWIGQELLPRFFQPSSHCSLWSKYIRKTTGTIYYTAQTARYFNDMTIEYLENDCRLTIKVFNPQQMLALKEILEKHGIDWIHPLIHSVEQEFPNEISIRFSKNYIKRMMERVWSIIAEMEPHSSIIMKNTPLRKDFEETFGLEPLIKKNDEKPSKNAEPEKPKEKKIARVL